MKAVLNFEGYVKVVPLEQIWLDRGWFQEMLLEDTPVKPLSEGAAVSQEYKLITFKHIGNTDHYAYFEGTM